jgi:hypothetical protein
MSAAALQTTPTDDVAIARRARNRLVVAAAAALAFCIAAFMLHTSLTLGWGSAVAPDGTRFKISPIGLSHVLQPDQAVSPTRDCRWSPQSGEKELCKVRPGGESAYRQLRSVGLIVETGFWFCILAALLGFLRPGLPAARAVFSIGALVAAPVAMSLFAISVPEAIAALHELPFELSATRATMQLLLATQLAAIGTALQFSRPTRVLHAVTAMLIALTAPFIGLATGGWLGAWLAVIVGVGALFFTLSRPSRKGDIE